MAMACWRERAGCEAVAKYQEDMPLGELTEEVSRHLRKPCHLRKISGYLNRTEVFTVNADEAAVKAYHHAADSKFAREVSAYRALEGTRLPVATLLAANKLKDGTPWICLSYLHGDPADHMLPKLTLDHDAQLLRGIGAITQQLHEIRFDSSRMFDGRVRPVNSVESQIVERYRRYRDAVLERNDPYRDVLAAASTSFESAVAATSFITGQIQPCLVHGDLSTRNFLALCSSDIQISGMLDFERSTFGDPAQDLAMIWIKDLQGNPPRETAFQQGYGQLSVDIRQRVRVHAIGQLFEIATWSWEMDRPFFEFAMATLPRLISSDRELFSAQPH